MIGSINTTQGGISSFFRGGASASDKKKTTVVNSDGANSNSKEGSNGNHKLPPLRHDTDSSATYYQSSVGERASAFFSASRFKIESDSPVAASPTKSSRALKTPPGNLLSPAEGSPSSTKTKSTNNTGRKNISRFFPFSTKEERQQTRNERSTIGNNKGRDERKTGTRAGLLRDKVWQQNDAASQSHALPVIGGAQQHREGGLASGGGGGGGFSPSSSTTSSPKGGTPSIRIAPAKDIVSCKLDISDGSGSDESPGGWLGQPGLMTRSFDCSTARSNPARPCVQNSLAAAATDSSADGLSVGDDRDHDHDHDHDHHHHEYRRGKLIIAPAASWEPACGSPHRSTVDSSNTRQLPLLLHEKSHDFSSPSPDSGGFPVRPSAERLGGAGFQPSDMSLSASRPGQSDPPSRGEKLRKRVSIASDVKLGDGQLSPAESSASLSQALSPRSPHSNHMQSKGHAPRASPGIASVPVEADNEWTDTMNEDPLADLLPVPPLLMRQTGQELTVDLAGVSGELLLPADPQMKTSDRTSNRSIRQQASTAASFFPDSPPGVFLIGRSSAGTAATTSPRQQQRHSGSARDGCPKRSRHTRTSGLAKHGSGPYDEPVEEEEAEGRWGDRSENGRDRDAGYSSGRHQREAVSRHKQRSTASTARHHNDDRSNAPQTSRRSSLSSSFGTLNNTQEIDPFAPSALVESGLPSSYNEASLHARVSSPTVTPLTPDSMELNSSSRGNRRAFTLSRKDKVQNLLGDVPPPPHAPIRASLMNSRKLTYDSFELCSTVGTGTFGRVRMVKLRNCADRTPLALKILKKSEVIRLKQIEHVKAEKAILQSIYHPFIVNMFAAFQDEKRLFMVMEFVNGGELFTYLRKEGRLDSPAAKFYACEIICALQYLHSLNIVYRDLKPENLLIDYLGHVKVTDFGFAKIVEDRTWTLCGTPEYLAPEVIQSKGYGRSADWWALGILIFEMLAGFPPFYDDDPFGIYQKVLAGKVNFPRHFDPKPKDLIKRLLTQDRAKRIGCLRAGADDVKNHKWFRNIDWDVVVAKGLSPPFVPNVTAADDTSMYEEYPESTDQEMAALSQEEQNCFADF